MNITISVSRTIQVKQYEPVTVSASETVECDEDDADEVRLRTYKNVTTAVFKYIENERRKYSAEK